ncbi:hypothetical protein [Pantoea agglomerans]|uniref:hypothetical protein n=1 Tax=Enterobacter agglomerans TaxID=549 RepID=UPI00241390A0|nr:hypothetical protein [Pantoea agglomerans]
MFDKHVSKKSLQKFSSRTNARNEKETLNKELLNAWDIALNGANADLKIIHCISSRGSVSSIGSGCENSPFLLRPVQSIFSSWDVISTCCLGRKVASDGSVLGRAPLDIHLNLRVPVQNIIGTHLRDVCFNNFAGLEGNVPNGRIINKGSLANSIFNGLERPNKIGFKMNEPYNILRHPDLFREQQVSGTGSYNEVLIVGRPGVRMYMNFPSTELVKLDGVSFRPNYFSRMLIKNSYEEKAMDKFYADLDFIKKILRINSINQLTFSIGRLPAVRNLNISQHFEKAGFRKKSDLVYLL